MFLHSRNSAMWNTGIKKKKLLQKLYTLLHLQEWLKLNRQSQVLVKIRNKENSRVLLRSLWIITISDIKLRNKLYAIGKQYKCHTGEKMQRNFLEEL